MDLIFLLVGGGWALLAVADFVMTSHEELSEYGMVYGFLFIAGPFVLQGLTLASVSLLRRFRQRSRRAVSTRDQYTRVSRRWVQKQLARLDRDFFSAKMGFAEYRQRRKTLVAE